MFDSFTLENGDVQPMDAPVVEQNVVAEDGIDAAAVVKKSKPKEAAVKSGDDQQKKNAERLAAHLQVALDAAQKEDEELCSQISEIEAKRAEVKSYVRYLQDTIKGC
jgi:hypothetical protein